MATFTPNIKPRPPVKTLQTRRNYYTLHYGANDAFTLKINEKTRTSIVSFTKWDDAIFIGKMMETHYVRQKEWPDMRSAGSLVLPSPPMGDVLHILYIQEWEFDDLKLMCTRNILDMISVDDILNRKSVYSFQGNVYRFEAPVEFYQMRFEEFI
jgi:hypothetical protein